MFPASYFSEVPRKDLIVIEPDSLPLLGQTLSGYMIHEHPTICLAPSFVRQLSNPGWVSVILLTTICWPLCLPFSMCCCYEGYQVPVYR
jgi:hypothetical protein